MPPSEVKAIGSNWSICFTTATIVVIAIGSVPSVSAPAMDNPREWTFQTKCSRFGGAVVSFGGDHLAYVDHPIVAENKARLWICHLPTGSQRELVVNSVEPLLITDVAFSPDDQYLAVAIASTGSPDIREERPAVWLWKAETGELVAILDMLDSEWTTIVSFSGDSRWLLGATGNSLAYVWDVQEVIAGTRKPSCVVGTRNDLGFLKAAVLSYDGQLAVLAGKLNSVTRGGVTASFLQVWDVRTESLKQFISSDGLDKRAVGVACSPTGDEVAVEYFSSSSGYKTAIYDCAELSPVGEVSGECPAYSPDGKWIVTKRRRQQREGVPPMVLVTSRERMNQVPEIKCEGKQVFRTQFIRSGELIIVDCPTEGIVRARRYVCN